MLSLHVNFWKVSLALMPFEMQLLGNRTADCPYMRTLFGGNKEKLCFNLTKRWPVETNCKYFQGHTKDSLSHSTTSWNKICDFKV